jgi:hypothetical protein
MARHAAGPIVKYDDEFFDWLRSQVIMVEDYAYAGLDFRGDPDLALPEGSQWGTSVRKSLSFCVFKCFCILMILNVFGFITSLKTNTKMY